MKIGKMQAGCFEFASICDICKTSRNAGSHIKCSKIRQERNLKRQADETAK